MRLGDLDDLKDHISELMLVYSGAELANAILNAIDNAPTVEINLVKVVEEHEKIGFKKGFNEGYTQAQVDLERPQGELNDLTKNQAYDKGFITAMKLYSRPKGEWVETQRGIHVTDYKCSCCGRTVRDDTGYDVASDYPFCHCGAEMRGAE